MTLKKKITVKMKKLKHNLSIVQSYVVISSGPTNEYQGTSSRITIIWPARQLGTFHTNKEETPLPCDQYNQQGALGKAATN